MNLIRGLNGLFPCPRCLVPKDKLSDLSLRFPLRTAEHTAKVLEAAEGQKRQTEKEKVLKSFSVRPITVHLPLFFCWPRESHRLF